MSFAAVCAGLTADQAIARERCDQSRSSTPMHSYRRSQAVYRHRALARKRHEQIELMPGESQWSKSSVEAGDHQPRRARDMPKDTGRRVQIAFADYSFQRAYHGCILPLSAAH
jgi:hypothetical protein